MYCPRIVLNPFKVFLPLNSAINSFIIKKSMGASPSFATAGRDPKTGYELVFRLDNPEES